MYEKLCETLLHGTDEEIDGIIYRRRQMTAVQIRACTKMLCHACRAPDRKERLMEEEVRTHGRYAALRRRPLNYRDSGSARRLR